MAGVGGVRATLPDMVRYLEGQLGTRDSAITPALELTQKQVASVDGHRMGMNWILLSGTITRAFSHEGGTGGYRRPSPGFDRAAKRAVVLLSDTALTASGGLGSLGSHLLDPSDSRRRAHVVTTAGRQLIDALVGKYRLRGGLGIELRHTVSHLAIQADGQPEFEMGYRQRGDFYPSSSTRCCGRNARPTDHTPSPGFRVVPFWKPSAWIRRWRSRASGRRRKRNSRITSATIR
jgi:hypothetical protein